MNYLKIIARKPAESRIYIKVAHTDRNQERN